ncbi:MAG: hypothetical protein ACK4J0_01760 [Candidatus Anstonellaceae archaeon]
MKILLKNIGRKEMEKILVALDSIGKDFYFFRIGENLYLGIN